MDNKSSLYQLHNLQELNNNLEIYDKIKKRTKKAKEGFQNNKDEIHKNRCTKNKKNRIAMYGRLPGQ